MSVPVNWLTDPEMAATMTFAAVFAIAGLARWRGYDKKVPLLRAIAGWVPGVSPFVIAGAALAAIPLIAMLKQLTAGEAPNPIAAVAFIVILSAAVAVRILTRVGVTPARLEVPIVAALFVILLLTTLVASPAIRSSVAGILFGSAALIVGGALAYVYARGMRRVP